MRPLPLLNSARFLSACLAGLPAVLSGETALAQTAAPAAAPVVLTPGSATTTPPAATTSAPATTTAAPAVSDAAATPAAPAAPAKWADTLKLGLQLDAGFTLNPQRPGNGLNWGQLFTDRANQVVINQAAVTLGRPLDPKTTTWDYGFKLQGLWGTDGRFVQPLGIFNHTTQNIYQPAATEASVSVHVPLLTEGGTDIKLGLFPTPLGYETIDPSTNPFYSHSYIFNFGLPFTSFGGYAVTHVNSVIDLYYGGDSGVNTTLGSGDNNNSPGAVFGTNLTLLDSKLTILALAHIGSENAAQVSIPPFANASHYMRGLYDIVATYKANDKLTFVTEGNLIHDDYFHATGGGVAQYVSYTLSDTITLNGRAEIWRDDHGFWVTGVKTGTAYVQAQYGYSTALFAPPGTYSEFTVGLTYKPTLPDSISKQVATFLIRPELRLDQALTGFSPYSVGKGQPSTGTVIGKGRTSFTAAIDAVLGF